MIDEFIIAVSKLAESMLPKHRWVLIVERKPGRFAIGGHCANRGEVQQIIRAAADAPRTVKPS